ncbi:putative iron-regulated membrane protein [Rhizomicrobium palustre]|uniref:Putative iron-regulated membrane protein n=1 Tax=Rhizomicrobium palustre TaxID=189966 RepID=A0A846N3G0_9PROT|nr:PepSY-associated TM helix domain-containing protein [Rhizomicrobium palustre]NIK89647.1 putative iron-regulated membrane protein [Rhizomicrobium palustre]
MFRKVLFQAHLWTGLILGIVFVVLGVTGALLVYQKELIALGQKPLPRAESQGAMLSADALIAAGKAAVPGKTDNVTLVFPKEQGEAAAVFMRKVEGGKHGHKARGEMRGPKAGMDGDGGRKNYTYVYLDPVSGKVLDVRDTKLNPFFATLHQLHANLMLGPDGRQVVGWFGAGMLLLGLSGIYLWWPRRGAWKYAFGIRKHAKGYLFHRDLHGAAGIWFWVVFVIVTFSGVVISFPATSRATFVAEKPAFDLRRGPVVQPVEGVDPIGADAAITLVKKEIPGAQLATISFPGKPDETLRVTLQGDPATIAFVDPYAKRIAGWRNKPADFVSWQRILHDGRGWGPVWRALVCISGLLPLLFTITGTVMWLKKRKGKTAALRVV